MNIFALSTTSVTTMQEILPFIERRQSEMERMLMARCQRVLFYLHITGGWVTCKIYPHSLTQTSWRPIHHRHVKPSHQRFCETGDTLFFTILLKVTFLSFSFLRTHFSNRERERERERSVPNNQCLCILLKNTWNFL